MDDFGVFLYNNLFLFIALIVIVGLLLWQTLGTGSGSVSPQQVIQLLNHEKAVVVDVREPSEVENGTIRGAIPVPLGELGDRLDELERYKERPVVCACRSGQRSARATGILRKNGFTRPLNLQGGIMGWQQASLPLGAPKEKSNKGRNRKKG